MVARLFGGLAGRLELGVRLVGLLARLLGGGERVLEPLGGAVGRALGAVELALARPALGARLAQLGLELARAPRARPLARSLRSLRSRAAASRSVALAVALRLRRRFGFGFASASARRAGASPPASRPQALPPAASSTRRPRSSAVRTSSSDGRRVQRRAQPVERRRVGARPAGRSSFAASTSASTAARSAAAASRSAPRALAGDRRVLRVAQLVAGRRAARRPGRAARARACSPPTRAWLGFGSLLDGVGGVALLGPAQLARGRVALAREVLQRQAVEAARDVVDRVSHPRRDRRPRRPAPPPLASRGSCPAS